MHDVLGFILGGGRGAGLFPLTKLRSTPAVPVAGQYRLIDIPISNCINSGMRRIYVLTQFLSVSLHRHIGNTYKFAPFTRSFVEVLAAQQTNEAADWYQGTADALRQNLRYLKEDDGRDVLILSGDGLYRMNYGDLIATHRQSGADITMAVVPVRRTQASTLGVVRVDDQNRLLELIEKPRSANQLDAVRASASWLEKNNLSAQGKEYLANMGIYVCRREVLLELLKGQPEAVDLVTQHFMRIVRSHHMQAHLFTGYWQDIGGSIRTYHEANLALAGAHPPFDFQAPESVIYTRMRNLPASRIYASQLDHCLISDGCLIEAGTRLERCVIGQRMRVGKNAVLRDTITSGADRLEMLADRQANVRQGIPDIGIGSDTVIHRAIIDKDCRIGPGCRIVNEGEIQHADGENYVIRDGIVVIPKGAMLPAGTVI